MQDTVAEFEYKNYKGEIATRKAALRRVWFGISEYHHGEQWFINAFDYERGDFRDFAISDIRIWKLDQEGDMPALCATIRGLLPSNCQIQ